MDERAQEPMKRLTAEVSVDTTRFWAGTERFRRSDARHAPARPV
ncbi:hypothetical protein [Streptomyces sp. NPDC056663]